MSNRLGGKQGTAYTGTNANQPPNWTFNDRPPTQYDTQNVSLGDLWLDQSAGGIDRVWVLVGLAGDMNSKGSLAQWEKLGVGDLEFLTGNTGGPVAPDGSQNINVVGDGTGITIAGNPGTNTLTASLVGGGTAAQSFPTDSGTATPNGSGVLNVIAANSLLNCGSTVKFTGSGNTVLLNVTDLPNTNTIIGGTAGNLTLTGTSNVGLGNNVLHALTSGVQNCALGVASSQSLTSGGHNVMAGVSSGATMTTASENVGIGRGALVSLVSGVNNLALGDLSGGSLVGAESSNVLIKNAGVAAESNTIRIGTQGGGAGQQNRAFMAGVRGVTTGVADAIPVVIDSAGQLGTAGTSPAAPCEFGAYKSMDSNNVTGDGTFYTVIYDTELYDASGDYNNATGVFTAPTTGVYHFDTYIAAHNISDQNLSGIIIATTDQSFHSDLQSPVNDKNADNILHYQLSVDVDLTAGDTVFVQISLGGGSNAKTVGITGAIPPGSPIATYFNGHRIDTSSSIIVNPTTYQADIGSAVPAAGILGIVGGTNVSTTGSGNTITINATPGGAASVAFSAYKSADTTNATGDSTVYTIVCDTVVENIGAGYNSGTGVFTAPVSGLYYFQCIVDMSNIGAAHTVGLVEMGVLGTPTLYHSFDSNPFNEATSSSQATSLVYDMLLDLNMGDAVGLRTAVSGGTKTVTVQGAGVPGNRGCFFNGYLIGSNATFGKTGFFAFTTTDKNNVTGDGTAYTVVFDTVEFDTASAYDNTTGIYTVPTTGYWQFFGQIQYVASIGGGNQFDIGLQGITYTGGYGGVQGTCLPTRNQVTNFYGPNVELTGQVSTTAFVTAGTTVSIIAVGDGGAKTDTLLAPPAMGGLTCIFWGQLL